ncbi:glycerophosphodiester phosphodiesterase family protein [Sphingobacterium sp. LRF_L2]|uniref:glycerophosphodiester phosphodiesterase family protein n=1 Tax=Sphingobacterium sp. LRF_L2 TaxID=3369421 RepID=UPI003F637286
MLKIFNCILLFAVIICFNSCFRSNTATDLVHVSNHNQVFNFTSVDDLYRFLTYSEKRVPLISAHRGGADIDYPENAIETFQRVAYKTPAIIECDISLTKDSALILMHDETLNRTSTGKDRISKHNLDEIKNLYLKDKAGNVTNHRIPTLEEALSWGIGKVIFTLDVKKNVPYHMVIDAIRKTKAEAYVVIITYSADQAALVHNLAPDLMISASIKNPEDLLRLNDRDVPDTRLVAFIGTNKPDNKITDLLHQHGILCILGTMGNIDKQAIVRGEQLYSELIDQGADILSTDRPIQAAKSLEYYINKRELASPYIN